MPLETQIIRNGKPLKLQWGGFHVSAMVLAAAFDSGEGPFEGEQEPLFQFPDTEEGCSVPEWRGKDQSSYPEVPCPISPSNTFELMEYHVIARTPLGRSGYKLKKLHRFVDVTDGEILELQPGDVLRAYRSHKS